MGLKLAAIGITMLLGTHAIGLVLVGGTQPHIQHTHMWLGFRGTGFRGTMDLKLAAQFVGTPSGDHEAMSHKLQLHRRPQLLRQGWSLESLLVRAE